MSNPIVIIAKRYEVHFIVTGWKSLFQRSCNLREETRTGSADRKVTLWLIVGCVEITQIENSRKTSFSMTIRFDDID